MHGFLDVGRFGHGVYYLTNGTVAVDGGESMGGFGPGKFVQYGGFNKVGNLKVSMEGEFHLYDGEITATNGLMVGEGDYATTSSFYQYGGTVTGDMAVHGRYYLNGGNIRGRMSAPAENSYQRVDATVVQAGGTNSAVSLDLGRPNRYGGMAFYTLSNGVLRVDSSFTFRGGKFSQYDGLHTVAQNLVLAGTDMGMGIATADYLLAGGVFSAGGITAQGATFQQDGGTNLIAGDIVFNAVPPPGTYQPPLTGRYNLGGGFLAARKVTVNATYNGGFRQTGGTSQIAEQLTLLRVLPGSYDFTLEGGTLQVKDIYIGSGAFFQHTAGTIVHSGLLTLEQGEWRAATGDHSLGPLRLAATQSSSSAIIFPDASSILRLANSSGQPWASSVSVYITNWHGSVSGGGQTRLLFGTDATGLTAQQLAVIKFSLPDGVYAARMLQTGEVVPDGLPTGGGQVNSWVKSGSGNWEENQWSLGTLPGAGQVVMITNGGWKAVAITTTTENFPDSLSVDSLTLESPPDSHNTLLFNYPGQAVPLTTRLMTVASNTAVNMFNGALKLSGGPGEGMSLGGEFIQDVSSTVLGSQMEIGYIGPGVYTLASGNVWLMQIWLGGPYAGRMLQTGGTNGADTIHIQARGEYDLVDGDFKTINTLFEDGALFRQRGGRVSNNSGLRIDRGTYLIEGGELIVPNITMGAGATFNKTGGVLTVSGLLTVTNATFNIGGGTHLFPRLSVHSGPGTQVSSTIYLPAQQNCVVVFEDSSQVPWSGSASITIANWNGNLSGGGADQLKFGTSASGLTQSQLAQIHFRDPAGFAPGEYASRMLQTGEVVPLTPTGRIPPRLAISRQKDGTMQITLNWDATANYGIDVSIDLFNWTRWTNVSTAQGTASMVDPNTTSATRKFYRAVLLP